MKQFPKNTTDFLKMKKIPEHNINIKKYIKRVYFPDKCVTFDRHLPPLICDKYHFVRVAVNTMLCAGECVKSNTQNGSNDVNM